jgi:sensor domain DACNV-containing protein
VTSSEENNSEILWLNSNDELFRRMHAQLEYLASIDSTIRWTPQLWEIRELIEVAFWASLGTNEERSTRARIVLAQPDLVPEAFALETAVNYEPAQVAKLAHVVPPDGSLLVCPAGDRLQIWGFSETPPGGGDLRIMAEIAAPGIVRINLDTFTPYVVLSESKAFFVEGVAPVTLPDYLRRAMRKQLAADDIAALHQGSDECRALAVLARMIVDQGHGGTILVVPDVQGKWVDSIKPFAFKYATPDVTAQEWARERFKGDQSLAEAVVRLFSSSLPPEDKMMFTAAVRRTRPRDAVRHIAPLANCDGAIVMTQDLMVLGFGAKITIRQQMAETVCRLEPIPGPQQLNKCTLEDLGGTRHQSAARFVAAHKDTVAIVVSQDRHMSVVNWSDEHQCVVAMRNAEWWA